MSDRIPIAGPSITQREIDCATDAAANGWYERAGEYPRRFEKSFAEYIGVKHAVSLPSCTSGLHLALAGGARRSLVRPAARSEATLRKCSRARKRDPLLLAPALRK